MENFVKSRPVFRSHLNLYWIAGLVLAFFAGMAVMNGRATQGAIVQTWSDAGWKCHEALTDVLQRQRDTLERQ